MKQKQNHKKNYDCGTQLTYTRHKAIQQNKPKNRVTQVPKQKQFATHNAQKKQAALSSSKSADLLSTVFLRGEARKTKKLQTNPEILSRYSQIKNVSTKPRFVSWSKYRKLTEDLEDKINFAQMGAEQAQNKREGKRIFASTNLFIESAYLGRSQRRYSQRKVNLNRTKSSVILT